MYKRDFLTKTDAGKCGVIRRASSLLAGSAALLLLLFNASAFAEGAGPGPEPINGVCVIKTQKVFNKETGVLTIAFIGARPPRASIRTGTIPVKARICRTSISSTSCQTPVRVTVRSATRSKTSKTRSMRRTRNRMIVLMPASQKTRNRTDALTAMTRTSAT